MASETRNRYTLAVVSVGAALVVLFAGAGVLAAVGHEVPKELWSAAAALSGALVGILIPPPRTKKDARSSATVAAAIAHSAATKAALDRAAQFAGAPGATPAVRQAAAAAAAKVRGSGLTSPRPPSSRPDPSCPGPASSTRRSRCTVSV